MALAWMETDALTRRVDANHDTEQVWAADIDLDVDAEAVQLADARYEWLCDFLTRERWLNSCQSSDTAGGDPQLPPLRAINVVIKGLLGRGVSGRRPAATRRRKGLAERLRATWVDLPEQLL